MKKILFKAIVLTASLLVAAAPASAQLDLVGTYLEVEVSPPLGDGELWDGSSVSTSVNVALCSDQEGGFNPAGGSVTVVATVSGPGWVEASVSPESIELTPATGPEPEPPGCMDSGSFSVSVQAVELDHSSTANIQISIDVGEGEGGDDDIPVDVEGMGTYSDPGGESASFSLQTIPAPSDDDDDEGNGNGGGSGTPDTNDSPAPAVAVLLLLLTALVSLRRRN